MKKLGDKIIIAEGNFAGSKAIIRGIDSGDNYLTAEFSDGVERAVYLKDIGGDGDEIGRIWVIYGEGNNYPKVIHRQISIAKDEMTRLAQANPGQKFYLLESVSEITYKIKYEKEEITY